jgi:hypothetical protein
MSEITFKTKAVSKKLLSQLNPRTRDIVMHRYGLDHQEKMTLESIGKKYDITRERVRQIENFALASIKKSKEFKDHAFVFDELKAIVKELGGVVGEESLMRTISKDSIVQNHIALYLALGDDFIKHKEDNEFEHHWSIDKALSEKIHKALNSLYHSISPEELVKEEEIYERFLHHVGDLISEYKENKEIINRYLALSKVIGKNQLSEWGHTTSPHIRARGIKDYAFLVLRSAGKPLHFKEVAQQINKTFKKKAHVATCHNELIKDSRFVLVGRGLYGLKEWGHAGGVVKDVISQVIIDAGTALSKEDIITGVLARRMVKPNTIIVNLQNSKLFKKDKEGKYSLVK